MEYQKKARRGQLCILIYVLLIFVCSFISHATSYSSSSSYPSSSDTSNSAILSASHSLSQPQMRSSSLSLSSSSLSSSSSSSSLSSPSPSSSSPQQQQQTPPQLQPSHQAISRQTLPETASQIISKIISSSPPLSSSSSSSTITNTTASSTIANKTNEPGKICGGIHIRNDLNSFNQLKGCKIINGPLTIALVSNINSPEVFKDKTFPDLEEVTDYLLFFRVTNLTTFSKLFPNLRVIRGRELVSNYALIIYEMMHLQRIDLGNLTDILRGSVRIENNPNLCYATTINWDGICKHKFTPHFIKDNNLHCNNRCPDHCHPWGPLKTSGSDSLTIEGDVSEFGADNNRSLFCWNSTLCHESCDDGGGENLIKAPGGGCCSPLCAGGCYERDRPDKCVACRHVSHNNRCVVSCDSNLFEFDGQCLDRVQCEQMKKTDALTNQCIKHQERKDFKAVRLPGETHGRCQENCPPGFEEDPTNKHRCKPCDKGKCRKVCTPQDQNRLYMVTNVNSLRELSGCNVINGSVEISMKGGKNVVPELQTAFEDLEEISGYLKITRSYPLITLDFLRGVKFINGSSLDRGQYSLVIIDNPNLEEIFQIRNQEPISKHLTILSDWDEQDVSIHNNGDQLACSKAKLAVEVVTSSSKYAVIKFENFAAKLDDPRSLLYYLINYREANHGNVTMFDGRDGCNSQNDVWTQVEEAPAKASLNSSLDEHQQVVIDVKPATRYALYVNTFTILAGSTGAQSTMIYFHTAPDTPAMPRDLIGEAVNDSTIKIRWLPPSKPNGEILYYKVVIKHQPENEEMEKLDVCNSKKNRDILTKTISASEHTQSNFVKQTATANNDTTVGLNDGSPVATSCPKINPDLNSVEIQESKVTFQDTIIDIVYLKNNCPAPNSSKPAKEKKKRSIEHEAARTDSSSDNSLPRKSVNSDQSPSRVSTNNDQLKRSGYDSKVITFNRSLRITEDKVDAPKEKADPLVEAMVTNLEHYRLYEIQVMACHGDFNLSNVKPSSTYSKCGLYATKQVRTRPLPNEDRVNFTSIKFHPANATNGSTITWHKPRNPNGLNLGFRIRYRLKNSNLDVWNEVCINITTFDRDGGLKLSNIGPGNYVASVRALSMYTEEPQWSDEIYFDIPHTNMLSSSSWTLIIISTIILIAIGAGLGTYYTRKKARDDLIYASVNPDYVQYKPDEWEVDKSKLIVGAQIGTGSFGMVYKGQMITEKGMRECAVKTVPPTSTAKQRFDFLREASIMKQFDTFHVVKLLGVVSVTTPVYVIMEYMENGDLKDFLRNQREIYQKQNKVLVDGIYLMAAQIADGMAYLASKKFVHRDLAARNCMVGENRIVKIGDFGLTRDIYANDYYRRDTQGRLPVRWMAPESLSDNVCTSASDAWSYGIVLWEMVTFSAYPYQGLSNDEVIKRVIQGYTMPRPEHCPDKLFYIMERCWRKNDKDRPTFLSIVEYLLPETEGKLYPNCYYRKPKVEGDSIAHTIPDDSNTGTESYPLLSWPSSNRANGLTNGDNHIMNHNHSSDHGEK